MLLVLRSLPRGCGPYIIFFHDWVWISSDPWIPLTVQVLLADGFSRHWRDASDWRLLGRVLHLDLFASRTNPQTVISRVIHHLCWDGGPLVLVTPPVACSAVVSSPAAVICPGSSGDPISVLSPDRPGGPGSCAHPGKTSPPGRMDDFRGPRTVSGLLEAAQSLLRKSWAPGTSMSYRTAWRGWAPWSLGRHMDPLGSLSLPPFAWYSFIPSFGAALRFSVGSSCRVSFPFGMARQRFTLPPTVVGETYPSVVSLMLS
ncbi:uncharacterized protein LOC128496815 [Spea bombifrons]|uniref:uncharacterized protein LOC128496815 n=1 Tax=Spea bombifrons TaxID=233779 RepID=UPI00234BD543|nr:uncharacterized protein LOC128496815 [Spea bombifrons]